MKVIRTQFFMRALSIIVSIFLISIFNIYAQPSIVPGCYISVQGRVYINPTNQAQTTYSSSGNLLDWVSNGSVCIFPNEYARRTGTSLGSCTVNNQGTGTKWLYTKISCPLDDYSPFLFCVIGTLGIICLRRQEAPTSRSVSL